MNARTALPVSVILPTHNRSAVLRRAIRSVLAQTRPPLELLVVDDASTEDIRNVIDEFGDARIRLLRLQARSGPGAARNQAAREARGQWLAFQDSDDEWLIDKLERQWLAADEGRTDAALVCGAYLIVPRQGPPVMIAPGPAMRQRRWSTRARFEFPFIAPTWLLRRDVFLDCGGFDGALPNLEDWELSLRLHDRGGFTAMDEPLLVKHGSADGLNKDLTRQVASLHRIRARHAALFARAPAVAARLFLRHARLRLRAFRARAAGRQP